MNTLTVEESIAQLESKVAEMMSWVDEMEALEPGEGAAIVMTEVERKRAELMNLPNGKGLRQTSPADKKPTRRRGGYRVAGDEGLNRWDLNY